MSDLVDISAESGFLSACLLDPGLLSKEIDPSWFVSGDNRRIFAAMRSLVARGEHVDPVSMMSELQRGGWDGRSATQAALGLTERVPPNPGSLLARLRLLGEARALSEGAALGLAHANRLELDQAREKLASLAMGGHGEAPIMSGRDLMEAAAQSWFEISDEARLEAAGEPPRFLKLAMGRGSETVRVGPGELCTIAAATGVGKSSLAITNALELEARGIRSGIVSVEDGREDWGSKIIGHVAKVRTAGFWQGSASKDEWQRATSAVGARDRDEIRLIHAKSASVDEVCGAMTRLVKQGACRVLFVDYIQAILAPNLKGVTRRDVTDYVLGRLMVASRVLGVPLVLLSQLSRPEKTRRFPEPHLSDLKESGTLENASHNVVMLWITTDDPGDADFGLVRAKVAKTKRNQRGERWTMRRGAGQVLEPTDHDPELDAI